MKNIFFGITIAAISFTACNSSNTDKSAESSSLNNDTGQSTTQTNNAETKSATPITGIVNGYLHLKNALTDK